MSYRNENQKAMKNSTKKKWTKTKDDEPDIIIIRSKELKKYILAAARSGGCPNQSR